MSAYSLGKFNSLSDLQLHTAKSNLCRLPTTSRIDVQRQIPPSGSKLLVRVKAVGKNNDTQRVDIRNVLTNPTNLLYVLPVVKAMDMVSPHWGRSENCLRMNKRKRIVGLKPSRNCLLLNSNSELKPALALTVVNTDTSLRLVLNRNLPDYLWEQWILFPPL